jgi:uncharacterized protein (DUF58 family)
VALPSFALRLGLPLPAAGEAPRPLLRAQEARALLALARGRRVTPQAQPVGLRAAGDQTAVWRGRGLDYQESRVYQAGDDLRDLHWRLLARTGKPFIKLYRDEHAASWHALLDLRAGMRFGTRLRTKAEQAARVVLLAGAAQALAADGAAGAMALTLWRESLQTVDLGRGLAAVRRLAIALQHEQIAPASDQARDADPAAFAAWAQRLARRLPEGSRLLLVTDGAGCDAPDIDAALWTLRSRAELRVALVQDPVERALPAGLPLAAVRMHDLAQRRGGMLQDAASAREAFAQRAQQHRAALLARWRARGIWPIDADVGQDEAALLPALGLG